MQIVLIGAGNVGYHLGRKLYESGEQILQVFSRNELKARHLATQIDASPISDFKQIL
ncbi:MAG: NAD(P)-binding domain-containing protein, partial [Bacteroidota bacterium]